MRRKWHRHSDTKRETMKCPSCGGENIDIAKYCRECGIDMTTVAPKPEEPGDSPASETPAKQGFFAGKTTRLIVAGLIVATVVIVGLSTMCFHEWKDATCTKAKICELCGKESGDPLGHN